MSKLIPTRFATRLAGLIVFASVGMLAILSSCAQQEGRTSRSATVNTGQPALHAIQSDRLKKAMRDLDRKASSPEEVRAESITGQQSTMDFGQVASAAQAISRTAGSLPELVRDANFSQEDHRVFASLAAKLRDEANELGVRAGQSNLVGTRAAIRRVDATCTACHATFRLTPVQ